MNKITKFSLQLALCKKRTYPNFMFFDRASLYNVLNEANQVHTTSQYIYFNFSTCFGQLCAIIRRTYCIYETLVFFSLYGWLSGLLQQQTRQPSKQSEKYQCLIDTVNSPDDGTQLPETCREVEINILRISVHLVGFI